MPSNKRSRQRAGRQARMAELRRAQQRRRNLRRGVVVAIAVAIAVALAVITTGGGSSKPPKKKTATSVAPNSTAAALRTIAAPQVSAACNTAASGTPSPTTIPAKGNAVATIAAPASVPFPALDGSAPHYTKFSAAPPFCIDVTKSYHAMVTTDVGTIGVDLLPANAPVTVNNFVFLAGYHYFDGIVFHRVVQGFVDQVGDPTGTGKGGPGYSFNDELPKSAAAYDAGALAMANSGPNTNGSQFFIVIGDGGRQLGTPSYSMFGQITSGLDVADKINADGSPPSNGAGTPSKLHRIESVTISVSKAQPTTPGT